MDICKQKLIHAAKRLDWEFPVKSLYIVLSLTLAKFAKQNILWMIVVHICYGGFILSTARRLTSFYFSY